MRLCVSLLIAVVLCAPRAFAESETYASERILVTTHTAVGFSSSLMAQPINSDAPCAALVTVEGSSIRFLLNGDLATATSGHILTTSGQLTIDSWHDMRNFRAISQDVANSTITASYQRGCR